jgi:hypothetical protein
VGSGRPVVKADDLFHIGVVAEDLDATTAALSTLLGYGWTPTMGGPLELTLPGTGDTVLDIQCAYSTSLPRLEVVRAVPGTMWEPVPGGGVHHVGYWSDDVAADAAALEEQGYELEASRRTPGGGAGLFFTFHRSPIGFRIELVTRAAQPSMENAFGISAAAPAGPPG